MVVFRKIVKEDAEEVSTLLYGLSDESKEFFHPHAFNIETLKNVCDSVDHHFVLIINNKIIGYSMLRFFGYSTPSYGGCIHNDHQGKHYGTLLLFCTLKQARLYGLDQVRLRVNRSNRKAFHLYKKIGFVKTGEMRDDDIVMMYNFERCT